MQRIFHTPEGVRDIYNGECSQKRKVQEKIHRVFHQYGYEDIETPTFEYFEVFSREVGTIPSKELYKFFDREGNTLVLRPDFTPSVSRACATYFSPDKEPVSLCYTGNTFINNTSYRGHLKETTQMGVERIGDESATSCHDSGMPSGSRSYRISGQCRTGRLLQILIKRSRTRSGSRRTSSCFDLAEKFFREWNAVHRGNRPKKIASQSCFCEKISIFGSC